MSELSIDVERYKEKPLYNVAVYDLLKELIENLRHSEYAKAIDNFVKL